MIAERNERMVQIVKEAVQAMQGLIGDSPFPALGYCDICTRTEIDAGPMLSVCTECYSNNHPLKDRKIKFYLPDGGVTFDEAKKFAVHLLTIANDFDLTNPDLAEFFAMVRTRHPGFSKQSCPRCSAALPQYEGLCAECARAKDHE